MVDVIRNFQYKTAGRGRGVLGLEDLRPCRRPGEKGASGGGGAAGKEAPAAGMTQGDSKPSGSNGEESIVVPCHSPNFQLSVETRSCQLC